MATIADKNKINLHYRNHVRVENKIYFSEVFFNGLFEIDLKDFSVSLICHFSDEDSAQMFLHSGRPVFYNDIIYFFPMETRRIHYYNLITNKVDSIIIPIADEIDFNTQGIIQIENRVWIFPVDLSNGVFILDMEKQNVINAVLLSKMLLKYEKVTGFIEIPEEGKVFTYAASDSVLLEIDIKKEQIKEYAVPFDDMDIVSINYHEGAFYFIDAVSGDLYEWTLGNVNFQKFATKNMVDCISDGSPFGKCCFVNDCIYMVPNRSKLVMKVNRNEGTIEKAFDYPENFQYLECWIPGYLPGVILDCEVVDSEIWFHPYGCNQLVIYNTESGQVSDKQIFVNANSIPIYEGVYHENNTSWSLEFFCNSINKRKQNNIVGEELQGSNIYRIIDGSYRDESNN